MKVSLFNGSRRWAALAASALATVLLASGCSNQDPYAGGGNQDAGGSGGGGIPTGSGGNGVGAGTGGGAGSGGVPGASSNKPARMVVLGDSIAACSNVGGEAGADCSLKKLYDYVKATYAPELVYENGAVARAVTADVPGKQISTVKTGPGHALVVIYIGGNDLAKYIFTSDAAATTGLANDLPQVVTDWDAIFAAFNDKAKFPDGVTMVMSNQYTPFDDCTAPPYNLSAKKIELLATFNSALKDVAQKKGALLTDQYTPFLGHGHHSRVTTCPHYVAGAAAWMDDLIHPNAAGHANLFEQWKKVVDQLYGKP